MAKTSLIVREAADADSHIVLIYHDPHQSAYELGRRAATLCGQSAPERGWIQGLELLVPSEMLCGACRADIDRIWRVWRPAA